MDNQEVVNFVEKFRYDCKKNFDTPSVSSSPVTPEAVSIAQLLCEEARTRWCTILEGENTIIDDISCIVLELHEKKIMSTNTIEYTLVINEDKTEISDIRRATTLNEVITRDPRRGSFCAPK